MAATFPSVVDKSSKQYLKTVRIEGVDIQLYDRGSGESLLLLHGMFGDCFDWEPVLEPLSRGYRVIAVDLPGFGESGKPDVEYTNEFFVRHIDSVLHHLGVNKVTIVGNSLGGILALLYALAHPKRVSGLVLVASGGFHKWTEKQRADALGRFSQESLKKLSPARHEKLFHPLFVNGESEVRTRYIEKQNAKLSRPDFLAYVNSLHSSVNIALDTILIERLGEIEQRVLLLHGEKDQVLLRGWTETALPNFKSAKLKIIPGCGHVPQLECPAEVVQAIEEFMASASLQP